jgi:ribosomal protein S18 acetylase RimI-like enzyme
VTADVVAVERIPPGSARELLIPLLLLADESEAQVRSYYQRGDLYVLWPAASDPSTPLETEPLGVVLALPTTDAAMELKAVAVAEGHHNRGLGKRLLAAVLAELRERGVRRVVVGTSNAGIAQFAFYQKAGFRFWRIERDFFTPERGYGPDARENGIAHRDMVWFDQDLT